MEQIFNFFKELFESELVKNNLVAVISAMAFIFVIGGFLVYLYQHFFHIKRLKKEREDLKYDKEKLEKQLSEQENNFNQLKNKYDILFERHSFIVNKSKELDFYDKLHIDEMLKDDDTLLTGLKS